MRGGSPPSPQREIWQAILSFPVHFCVILSLPFLKSREIMGIVG